MEAICTLLGATTRPPVYQRLFRKGIVIHPHLHVRAIEGDTLITENAWTEIEGKLTGYDAVVLCVWWASGRRVISVAPRQGNLFRCG